MVTLRRALLVCIPLAALGGCRAIAGLHDIEYEPASTTCSVPTLPSSGNGRIRLVNVGTQGTEADFCIRASGTSAWGTSVFAETGPPGCHGGLAYAQSTIPFAVPPGKVDVKAIASGETCAATGTSEIDEVSVGDHVKSGAPVMTFLRYGGGSSPETVVALPESTTIAANDVAVRVVNALSGGLSIEWGFSAAATLPATVALPVDTLPIAPGAAASPSATASDATFEPAGYAAFLDSTALNIGLYYADDPTRNALAIGSLPIGSYVGTFYAIGDPSNAQTAHPVRGLFCADDLGSATPAIADAGSDEAGAPRNTLADCTLSPLSLFSVDLINVSLYDIDAPFEAARRPYIYRDLAARSSDFMCVVEVGDIVDRSAIVSAAMAPNAQGDPGRFPYSYMVTTDDTTPPSNPSDVRPTPANPPCGAAAVEPSLVSSIYSCVEQHCSTVAGGDPSGQGIPSGTTNCLSTSCILPLGAIYTAPITPETTPQQFANDYCFDCVLYNFLSGSTFATQQAGCTTQSTPPFVLGGQTPILILSHYPIASTSVYYLPATGYRRAILKAQAQAENGKAIDFFCGDLVYPFVDSDLPYTGTYGSDIPDDGGTGNGWRDEADLQAREGLAWIKAQVAADGVPAIVAMDLQSDDPGTIDDGGFAAMAPEVEDLFASGLTPAVVPNAPLSCDLCSLNPYNGGTIGPGSEFLHTYLSGFSENATQTETLWGTDDTEVPIPSTVPDQPAPAGGTGPLSAYYAHNYTIVRP